MILRCTRCALKFLSRASKVTHAFLSPSPLSILSRRPGMRPTSTFSRPKSAQRRTTWRRSKPAYWEVSSWRAASASSARRSHPRPSVRLTVGSTGGPLHRGAEGISEDQRPQPFFLPFADVLCNSCLFGHIRPHMIPNDHLENRSNPVMCFSPPQAIYEMKTRR